MGLHALRHGPSFALQVCTQAHVRACVKRARQRSACARGESRCGGRGLVAALSSQKGLYNSASTQQGSVHLSMPCSHVQLNPCTGCSGRGEICHGCATRCHDMVGMGEKDDTPCHGSLAITLSCAPAGELAHACV